MKVLIIASHIENVSSFLLMRGFRQLGHEVKSCGPHISGQWQPDFRWLEQGLAWQPDLVILADHHIYPDKRPDCRYVLFTEDPVGFAPGVYDVRNKMSFDWEFYCHKADCMGRVHASHLLMAYDPTIHKPGPVWGERPIPVSSAGQMSNSRKQLISYVEKFYPVVTGYGDLGNYVLLYQNTKIALCHSRIGGEVEQRILEQMAMGCLVLSEPRLNFGDYGIVPERDLLIYENQDIAARLIQAALDDPITASIITLSGQRIVAGHTWAVRAQTILDTLGGIL